MRTANSMQGGDIESNTEYHPELLGTAELEAGEPEQVWDDYALELVPIKLNGDDTDQRMILRNGEYIATVSDNYRLLPNEKMVEAANEVADELGAVPFNEFSGDWYIELDDHVFQDDEGRRAHAMYAWEEEVDIGGGDPVTTGFAVHNSIDGSLGFNVGLFTFRHACANMVTMGINGQGQSFDQRSVLSHSSHKHTHGLEIQNLKAWIEDTVSYVPEIHSTYSQWKQTPAHRDEVLELLGRAKNGQLSQRKDLPGWMQRAIDRLDETEERAEANEQLGPDQFEGGLPEDVRAGIVEAEMPQSATTWDVYNDLTQNIWHSDETNDQSKRRKMKAVHRTMPVAQGQDDEGRGYQIV